MFLTMMLGLLSNDRVELREDVVLVSFKGMVVSSRNLTPLVPTTWSMYAFENAALFKSILRTGFTLNLARGRTRFAWFLHETALAT